MPSRPVSTPQGHDIRQPDDGPPTEPFVGRAEELTRLCRWATEVARTGIGRFVLVTGDAGVGKTRLCHELSRQLTTYDFDVAVARCWTDGGAPPLWPWPDIIDELAQQRGRCPSRTATFEQPDQFALFAHIVDELRSMCADATGIALIDDVHASSEDVTRLTTFVARHLHRFPLLLLATWRTERPETSESATRLSALARDADVVDLRPFGRRELLEYLGHAEHDHAAPEVSRLLAATGGNPMYVAELVRDPPRDGTDAGLARALERRVAGLGAEHRRILGTAAVVGSGTTIDELATLLDCSPSRVVDVVGDSASAARVVDGRIIFSHDLLRDAFRAGITDDGRRALHARAAETMRVRTNDDVVRRAHHAVEAASISAAHRSAAIAACRDAWRGLQRALAFDQAARWAATGCALAAESGDVWDHADLALTYARAVLTCGRLGDARELYWAAAEVAEQSGDPRQLATAAVGLGGLWIEEQRDELSRRRMLSLCQRAAAALPAEERALDARLAVRLAAEQAYGGSSVQAVFEAVDAIRRLGDRTATAEALSLLHHTLLTPDHAGERLAVADELLDRAAHPDTAIYSLLGLCWRTVDLYLLGDPAAERSFVDLRERSTALGSVSIRYIAAVMDVMRSFRRGELQRAEEMAQDAFELGQQAGDADALAYFGAHLLAIRWVQGRLGDMRGLVESVMDSSTLRRRDKTYEAVHAAACAFEGDTSAARAGLDTLVGDPTASIPMFPTWTTTLATLIETAAAIDDGDLAMHLAAQLAPYAHLPVMPSLAVVCLGPGERPMGVAAAAAGQLDDAVGWFRAALRSNHRLQSRPYEALIRGQLAGVLARRSQAGDHEEARQLYQSAIDLGTELGLTARCRAWQAEADRVQPGRDAPTAHHGILEQRDSQWHVEVDGRSAVVGDLVGFRHIAELIARPDTDIPADVLAAGVPGAGEMSPPVASRGAPSLDARARREYEQRLRELERELDGADLAGDRARGRRASEERACLLDQLRRDVGLAGRVRRMSDDTERTRMRVSKAIRRAIHRVGESDPILGHVLEARIRTGHMCRYETDLAHPITWSVRRAPATPVS